MKHFNIEQWTDFTRGVVAPPVRAEMDNHLSSGCRKCNRTAEMLREVISATDAESHYQVPAYAVRCARAIYALQHPEKMGLLPRLLAKLSYDSFRDPLPAGVRSGHRVSRQVLYVASDYSVDLRLEQERDSSQVTVVGQIASRKDPNKDMSGLPVFMMSGKKPMVRTLSNRFGEFQLECQPKDDFRIHLSLKEDGKLLEVPLNQLITEAPEDPESKSKPEKTSSSRPKTSTRKRGTE